jgi:ABC-type oligopeptide transport system ATPase subunit
MTALQIDQVSKLFQGSTRGGGLTPALRKVSFDIDHGEVVTLIGESGSGKTTLGRIILRLTAASSGRVVFEGNDISVFGRAGLRDYYRRVQGVFQDPFSSYNPVYKADRVFELIRGVYFPHMREQAWRDKIEAALHAVALNSADVMGKYPHQLSGGQQQRLLIARALLLDVKLLVADEIISMLDASTRVDILNLLISLKRSGLAILFITHDLSLGNYVSDRTVILRHGAIVEMGDTVKVFSNPQHPYTKNLLTAVPELHKKWQAPLNGAEMDLPAGVLATGTTGASGVTPAHTPNGHARQLARTGRAPRPVIALEPPPLELFEKDHLVAAAEA